jgi:Tol biopolymer transport system component
VAFDRSSEVNTDVWVMDLSRGADTRITFDPTTDNLPIWSPDGLRILWSARRGGRGFNLYTKAASGGGDEERLIEMGTVTGWASDWSRDGRFVLYQRPGDKTGQDLWMAPQPGAKPAGDGKPVPYLNSQFNEANGVFSPDGRWVAYESDESGRFEVYVQAFPLTREKERISTGGGSSPAWSAKGELFYLAADRRLMAVPYRGTADTFEPGAATPLFALPGAATRRAFAVSADGRRFLATKPLEGEANEPITVVLNWQSGLAK